MKVLIVEDNEISLLILKSFLKSYQFQIIEAKNGQEGYELWKEHHPDIVITDLIMPLMNGDEFMKKVKMKTPETICILITAQKNSIEYKFYDYLLTKPVIRESLCEIIDDHFIVKISH